MIYSSVSVAPVASSQWHSDGGNITAVQQPHCLITTHLTGLISFKFSRGLHFFHSFTFVHLTIFSQPLTLYGV